MSGTNTDNLTEEAAGGIDPGTVEAATVGENFDGDMSIIGLFMQADIVVKLVMVILVGCSVWTWALIFDKRRVIDKLNKRAQRFEEAFWSGESLDKLHQRVKKSPEDPMLKTFSSGMDEWHAGVANGIPTKEHLQVSLKQRIERAMMVMIGREMQRLEKGMTFMASIGSTAPFIGLFGTVWGIMNSFSSIAMTNNTSLAVVAPGIAEALFATALGLVAAIPAVLAYNIYSAKLTRYADRLETFSSEFATILERHMDEHDRGGMTVDRSRNVAAE